MKQHKEKKCEKWSGGVYEAEVDVVVRRGLW